MKNQDKTAQSDLLKQNPAPLTGGPASPTGGPQFGFAKKDGSGKRTRGWFNKYGSSVILPIIALLILAGGIYLYASQKSQEETILPFEEEMAASLEEGIADLTEELTGQEEEIIEEIIPEGRKEAGTIIEKAVKGDGVTHLARRALKDYLNDNPQELTNEHKVYIEDYLKDNIGSRPLEINEEIAFSEDLIKEAIDASLQLTPEQLKVIEKYSALVVW
ncbi:MAG: hypothetical protein ISS88_02195 [Candidatus Portnoybacteria bacterium]|nr:hypothetical protein [Candidatus Portnoybacteria bacterium]